MCDHGSPLWRDSPGDIPQAARKARLKWAAPVSGLDDGPAAEGRARRRPGSADPGASSSRLPRRSSSSPPVRRVRHQASSSHRPSPSRKKPTPTMRSKAQCTPVTAGHWSRGTLSGP